MLSITQDKKKIIAAKKALEFVKDGNIIGIGSGSTVKYFIRFLGEEIRKGNLREVKGIPSSYDTRILMQKAGIPVTDFIEYPEIDVTVDGADSVLLEKRILIKGGGGAFLREKIIDYAAKKLVIIVDDSKLNREFPVPIEVLPFALGYVIKRIETLGARVTFRESKGKVGPCVSDNGNIIIDALFDHKDLVPELEIKLNMIPGVLENGIFNAKCNIIVGLSDKDVKTVVF